MAVVRGYIIVKKSKQDIATSNTARGTSTNTIITAFWSLRAPSPPYSVAAIIYISHAAHVHGFLGLKLKIERAGSDCLNEPTEDETNIS